MVEIANLLTRIRTEGVERSTRQIAGFERVADRAGRETDEFSRSARRASTEVRGFGQASQGASSSIGSLVAGYASAGAVLATLTIGARTASRANLELSRRVAEVGTITGDTTAQLRALQDQTLSLAATFGGTATAQTQAYYGAYSAGAASFVDATSLVVTANQIAIGGVADLDASIQVLASTMNAYRAAGLSAANVSDLLFIAVKNGIITIPQLSRNLATVTSTAASFGVALGTVTASLAALTATGVRPAVAATQVRALILALQRLTPEQVAFANSLGITDTGPENFIQFLTQYNAALGRIPGQAERSAAATALFGGQIEALQGAQGLAIGGFETFTRTLQDNANAAGATADAFARVDVSPAQQVAVVLGELNSSAARLGETINVGFIPAFQAIGSQALFASENLGSVSAVLGIIGVTTALRASVGIRTAAASFFGLGGAAVTAQTALRGTLRGLGRYGLLSAGAIGATALLTGETNLLTSALTVLPLVAVGANVFSLTGSFLGASVSARVLFMRMSTGIRAASSLSDTIGIVARVTGTMTLRMRAAALATNLLSTATALLLTPVGIAGVAAVAAGAGAAYLLYRDRALTAQEAIQNLTKAQVTLHETLSMTEGITNVASRAVFEKARADLVAAEAATSRAVSEAEAQIAAAEGYGRQFGFAPNTRGLYQERDRLQGELDRIRGLLRESGFFAAALEDNIAGLGLPPSLLRDVVRIRTEFDTLTSAVGKTVDSLDGIFPEDRNTAIIRDAQGQLEILRNQTEADQILLQSLRSRRFNGSDQNPEGFAILDNDITTQLNRVLTNEREREALANAISAAQQRIANNVEDTAVEVQNVSELTEDLASIFENNLTSAIQTATSAVGDFAAGSITSIDGLRAVLAEVQRDFASGLIGDNLNSILNPESLLASVQSITQRGGLIGPPTAAQASANAFSGAGFGARQAAFSSPTGGFFGNGGILGTGVGAGSTFISSVAASIAPIFAVAAVGAIGAELVGRRRDTGITGTAGGGLVDADISTIYTGLIGLSTRLQTGSRRGTREATSAEEAAINTAFRPVFRTLDSIAEDLGVTFTRASFSGATATEAAADYANAVAMQVGGVTRFNTAGEALIDTLDRLATSTDSSNRAFNRAGFGDLIGGAFTQGLLDEIGGAGNIAATLGLRTDAQQRRLAEEEIARQSGVTGLGVGATNQQLLNEISFLTIAIRQQSSVYQPSIDRAQRSLAFAEQNSGLFTAQELVNRRNELQRQEDSLEGIVGPNLRRLQALNDIVDEFALLNSPTERVRLGSSGFRTEAEQRLAESAQSNPELDALTTLVTLFDRVVNDGTAGDRGIIAALGDARSADRRARGLRG